MGSWDGIRALARKWRAELRGPAGSDSADALLAQAEISTKYRCRPANRRAMDGGLAMLDPVSKSVWFDQDAPAETARLLKAHEFAHLRIDDARFACGPDDVVAEASEERLPMGVDLVEGYSPQERRELQANVFAREFLLPTDHLRRWVLDGKESLADIRGRTGLPEGLILHQMARALLTADTVPTTAPVDSAWIAPRFAGAHALKEVLQLDDSQRDAAQVAQGPALIDAGPGTGKTRTLVGRVSWLLNVQSVEPSALLVLTFSNRAADELRDRVSAVAPAAAPHMWTGTFHAFGLELLRKYGTRIGLPNSPRVLDPAGALFLLESHLRELELDHYLDFYDPARGLRDILRGISEAKDFMIDPDSYAAYAEAQLAQATSDDEVTAAEKAGEVGRVYKVYQRILQAGGQVDFGDLITRSAVLLREHGDIRDEFQERYPHILVDEFQDVNFASAELLRGLAGDGVGLWVVGDVRQSIFRFRGANPSNIRRFPQEFPGARTFFLSRNYRSRPAIVATFEALAPKMLASNAARAHWQCDRNAGPGIVKMEIAADLEAEGEGLAAEIQRQRDNGIPYRDQAVLARSHTQLTRYAQMLERAGIPVLYLGDLFERPEVQNLLALLSLACEARSRGLALVAEFPEYAIPAGDVDALCHAATEQRVPFPAALRLADDMSSVSLPGKVGIALVRQHIDGICYGTTAWGFLTQYLFDRAAYLPTLLGDESAGASQQKLAIFQLLQFAYQQRAPQLAGRKGEDPKRAFLRYIRRLETFGEEKQLRQMPSWAAASDAVRMLTIHAAKGLEFRAVYLPGLSAGKFPANRHPQPCPAPSGMLRFAPADAHDEEEQCLLFVALSRARDVLYLSRPATNRGRKSNMSKLLGLIAEALPREPDADVSWQPQRTRASNLDVPPPDAPDELDVERIFDAEELDQYLDCPRWYYDDHIRGMARAGIDSPYFLFQRCVRETVRWMQSERVNGHVVDVEEARSHLNAVWLDRGPVDHAFAGVYLAAAEEMVEAAVPRVGALTFVTERPTWEVERPRGRVRVRADLVLQESDEEIVQQLRTGRITKSEKAKDIYALLAVAGRPTVAERRRVEIVSLSRGNTEAVDLSDKNIATRLGHYDDAIDGIVQNQFPTKPNDWHCPRCPSYFNCRRTPED